MIKFISSRLSFLLLVVFLVGKSYATTVAQSPLFLNDSVPPIVMLTMGRDHKLYYEAYNDASDLNEDGVLDIRYKPTEIDYYGYFDSYKCYNYTSGVFVPSSVTVDKKCSGNWSGDFLNYITTSRMDALRKVLYGGSRSTDSTSETILKRAYIPQDAHSWGKEYTSTAIDGYDIAEYSPLSQPTDIADNVHPTPTGRHLFANTTLSDNGVPILRLLQNNPNRIHEWVSKERPVADTTIQTNEWPHWTPQDFNVYVKVCVAGMEEGNCKAYSDGSTTTYKPTGLLQRYGDDELMAFGLLTGSYRRNMSGGVIRKNISSFQDEVDLDTGIFETGVSGIVDTIDKIRIKGFKYPSMCGNSSCRYQYGGWKLNGAMIEGTSYDWGNPIAEMMYEGVRYFAGKSAATPDFVANVNDATTPDVLLGLPLPSWEDPYRTTAGGYPSCAKPIQLVISDVNNSYDTDQLPGSSFDTFSSDLSEPLNVSTLADTIWAGESEASNIFIGQSGNNNDGTPSAKSVTSFKNIRGLAPEEPTKMGGYYAGSVALYGKKTDISDAIGKQNIDTIAVALASPLPRIEIPVAGKIVTLVPFAKSVYRNAAIDYSIGAFQPTNQIVDFFVETMANTGPGNMDAGINGGRPYGKFAINYEDVEQGADHDMDAIVEYTVWVTATDELKVRLNSVYAAGSIVQHMGYVISGTTKDGTYLEVRDADTAHPTNSSNPAFDTDYFLDTPPGTDAVAVPVAGGPWADNALLPLDTTRTFTVGSSVSASFVKHPPLWYAAKWSMTDDNENGILETSEWDSDTNGDPDGYFLVTNAGKLEQQLEKAFSEVLARTSSAAAAATNSTRLDANTKLYQARFTTANWEGQFRAYSIDATGTIASTHQWDAATLIPAEASRNIYSYNPVTDDGIEFSNTASNLSANQLAELDKDVNNNIDSLAADRVSYLRGDQTKELKNTSGVFRNRASLMGDVINSDPWFVSGIGNFGYSRLPGIEGSSYAHFRISKSIRVPAIYFGANEGMLHAINANDGAELFTYVPDAVIGSLNKLTSPLYGCTENGCIPHRYFVDGPAKSADAYVNLGSGAEWHTILVGTLGAGGKGIFALDITNPEHTATTGISGVSNSSLSAFSESNILWEISPTQPTQSQTKHDNDLSKIQNHLGYTISQASIVRMNNGKWAAIVANGYDSNNNKAVLFIIDIETGEIMKMINTGEGSSSSPNGLSTPIVIDNNGDRMIDTIYAGDLRGNLWKFDVRDSIKANWGVADVVSGGNAKDPLFIATDSAGTRQAITGKPQIGNHPDGGKMVYFGTGKYYAVGDQIVASPAKVHTFYGIRDQGAQVASRSNLQQQEILYELTKSSWALDIRVLSDTTVDYTSKQGWYMDLISPGNPQIAQGERVVGAPLLRDGRIIFTTLIPTPDPCGWGGDSWFIEMDAIHGGALDEGVFGEDYEYEMIDIDADGTPDKVYVSGVKVHGIGIVKASSQLQMDDNKEKIYLPGSNAQTGTLDGLSSDPDGRQSWQQIQ